MVGIEEEYSRKIIGTYTYLGPYVPITFLLHSWDPLLWGPHFSGAAFGLQSHRVHGTMWYIPWPQGGPISLLWGFMYVLEGCLVGKLGAPIIHSDNLRNRGVSKNWGGVCF